MRRIQRHIIHQNPLSRLSCIDSQKEYMHTHHGIPAHPKNITLHLGSRVKLSVLGNTAFYGNILNFECTKCFQHLIIYD